MPALTLRDRSLPRSGRLEARWLLAFAAAIAASIVAGHPGKSRDEVMRCAAALIFPESRTWNRKHRDTNAHPPGWLGSPSLTLTEDLAFSTHPKW
jgi:hypothetical protein